MRHKQGDLTGPWPVTPSANHEQQHSMNKHDFVPSIPGPAVASWLGREVETTRVKTPVLLVLE